MNTLITSGCSYTKYKWDTWADYLGDRFVNYKNLGVPGAGNKFIYHSILDYIFSSGNILHNHTFVIEWSSIKRHDFIQENGDWATGGQVDNNEYFDHKWVEKYFDLEERIRDLYYYVNHIKHLQKVRNFKLKMFYMFEPWIDEFAGEPASISHIYNKKLTRYVESSYLHKLKDDYMESVWISPSLEKFNMQYSTWGKLKDTHPPTKVHKDYAKYIYGILEKR